jgi:hypothetical protein
VFLPVVAGEAGPVEGFALGVPGDGMDGYAREVAVTSPIGLPERLWWL